MIRVLHIIPMLSTGGAARALIAIAKYSSREDTFVHRVISLRPAGPEAVDLAVQAGLEVLQASDQPALSHEMTAADIVHVHWWNDARLQSLLRGDLPPARLLLWYHVAGDSAPQIITDELADLADLNVATNPWSYRELAVFRNMAPADRDQRVAMVIDGADFERVRGIEPKPHPHFNVGYIGTVNFVKMHRNFVPMNAAISIPEARFIVCGHGIETQLLEQAARLGAADRFDFRGYVSDIKPVIEVLDVYGYPLCEDTYASGELNLQEVMCAGVPPVVFPYGGIKGLVENNKTGLVVSDETEYREAIEFLYHHPEERNRLGKAAQEHALEHFGAENSARLLNLLYERLMRGPKRRRSWGCRADSLLLEQPVSLFDVLSTPDRALGARQFVDSLGDAGKDFLTSLTAMDLSALWDAERAIAQSSPLLRSAGSGGILHYRDAFPDDAYLRLWSGLVLRQEGKFDKGILEFERAIDLGCDHWRVGWYIDQARREAKESALADAAASATSKTLLGEATAPTLHFGQGDDQGNPDGLGRHWFKAPASGTNAPDQFDDWVYDPERGQLYKAAKNESPVEAVITAETLGLEPGAELIGKDPFGRYWFKIREGEKRIYNAKEKQLYRAIQEADGKWTLEKITPS